MNLKELYLKRESCRNFNGEKIKKEVILEILDEARLAPSARNSQPWHFWLVENEELFSKMTGDLREFTQKAGGMVIITTDNRIFVPQPRRHDYYGFDVGGLTSHIILSAANKGIQTCLIGSYDDDFVKRTIPELKNEKIHIIVLFGKTSDKPREKDRLLLKDQLTIL